MKNTDKSQSDKSQSDWYVMSKGTGGLPESCGQGQTMVQRILAPIRAQIALSFGDPAGDVVALHEGVAKFRDNKPIDCKVCGRQLFTGDRRDFSLTENGHSEDCELKRQALEVLNGNEGDAETTALLAEVDKLRRRLDKANRKLGRLATASISQKK